MLIADCRTGNGGHTLDGSETWCINHQLSGRLLLVEHQFIARIGVTICNSYCESDVVRFYSWRFLQEEAHERRCLFLVFFSKFCCKCRSLALMNWLLSQHFRHRTKDVWTIVFAKVSFAESATNDNPKIDSSSNVIKFYAWTQMRESIASNHSSSSSSI